MIHALQYKDFGGRKVLTKEEEDALTHGAQSLLSQSTTDLRAVWREALKKEVDDRKLEIETLCRDHDISSLHTMLEKLRSIEAALPPLPKGYIRPDCYACALPIAGSGVRGAHGRTYHERCFVCKQCGTHLSALAPTVIAFYDNHYCMPCGKKFDPQDHFDAPPPSPVKREPAPAAAAADSDTEPVSKPADPAMHSTDAPSASAKGDLRDAAKSRLLSVISRLETQVDEMDEEEKKLVAQIEEEQARIRDVERRQRVERFRARQGSFNLPIGQRPGQSASADAVMAAAALKASQPDAIDSETLKSLEKEQKLYSSSEQSRKKLEQMERLQKFKSALTQRKDDVSRSSDSITSPRGSESSSGDPGRSSDSIGDIGRSSESIGEDDEAEKKRKKEQEILDLIAEEEHRREKEERERQVANVRYFLDDLKQSTLAVLEKEATGSRVSAKELDVVERNLERADMIFGVDAHKEDAASAGEGRFERTLDKLLSLMENPDALSKLAQLVSPNVAPQGQSHVAFYEKVKQDNDWARKQREAREAELASIRRNNL